MQRRAAAVDVRKRCLDGRAKLASVEYVHYKSKDGTPVSAFLYKPPDFAPGKRYPTILLPHGGPVWAFYSEFNFEPQIFAENGYVVITPNARGSTGYGQKFSQAILADWGDKDFEDYMAGWTTPSRRDFPIPIIGGEWVVIRRDHDQLLHHQIETL